MTIKEEHEKFLKQVTVKIETTVINKTEDREEKIIGSGIIYKQDDFSDFVYIFTAAHCIYGDKFQYDDSHISQIIIDCNFQGKSLEFSSKDLIKSEEYDKEDDEYDFVILSVPEKEIKDIYKHIPIVKIINEGYAEKHYTFRGYPVGFDFKAHWLYAEYHEDDGTKFELETKLDLGDITGRNAKDIVSGFSGSGVFIKDTKYLAGILIRLKDEKGIGIFNVIYCLKLIFINKLLNSKNLSEIKFYSPVDISEQKYLEECLAENKKRNVLLMAQPATLPNNLHITTYEDPLENDQNVTDIPDNGPKKYERLSELTSIDIVKTLASTEIGSCTLLLGKGGGGKTTTLQMTLIEASQRRIQSKSNPLPVLIYLNHLHFYKDLYQLIEKNCFSRWDSLPGPFLLLCDGLNEAPVNLQKKLLIEISDIIKKHPVAIVLTLRSSGLPYFQTLNKINKIYELVPLTMQQIIQMAQSTLDKEQFPLFIDEFKRRLGFRNPSIFTLPFGVALSIQVFKETGDLPRTATDLIEKYLLHRFKRNMALHDKDDLCEFDYKIVRILAERIAFQMRIRPPSKLKSCVYSSLFSLCPNLAKLEFFRNSTEIQRAILSKNDIQKIVHNALKNMKENMYEVSDLSVNNALKLLRHYEFLILENGEFYRFEHDLISDFLASKELAKSWKANLLSLNYEMCDDAWIFASEHIPVSQYASYLKCITEIADLSLAASCALTLRKQGIELIEPLLFEEDKKDALFSKWQSTKAMSILGSQSCIEHMKRIIKKYEKRPEYPDRYLYAREALSRIGEEQFLSGILSKADEFESIPIFSKTSGGEKYLWEIAPAKITLKLARQRLQTVSPKEGIVLSINTVAHFGDSSDADLIKKIITEPTIDLKTLFTAFYCLYKIDSKMAVERIQPLMKENLHNCIYIMDALFKLGHYDYVDYNGLLSFVMDDFHKNSNLSERKFAEYERLKDTALKILKKASLPNNAREVISDRLKVENKKNKRLLWRIAAAQQLDSADELAQIAIMGSDIDEMGNAANFAQERLWSKEADIKFLKSARSRFERGKYRWTDEGYYQLLKYLVFKGEFDLVSQQVNWQICMLNKKHIFSKDFKEEIQFVSFLEIASQMPTYIDKQLIKNLMHIDLMTNSRTKRIFKYLLQQLEEYEIDEELKKITKSYFRKLFLSIISELGKNRVRLQIFKEEIVKSPYPQEYFCKVISNIWCEDIVEILVETIETAPWVNKNDYQLYKNIVRTVANRVTRLLAIRLIKPKLKNKRLSSHRISILQLWYDMGTKRRTNSF